MKLNFTIENGTAEIKVDPRIFPKEVVLRSAYKFIDRAWISVEKDGNSEKILVKLLPREKKTEKEIEKLAFSFNMNLVTSYVEDMEAERYAESRNSMIKAAMLSQTNQKK